MSSKQTLAFIGDIAKHTLAFIGELWGTVLSIPWHSLGNHWGQIEAYLGRTWHSLGSHWGQFEAYLGRPWHSSGSRWGQFEAYLGRPWHSLEHRYIKTYILNDSVPSAAFGSDRTSGFLKPITSFKVPYEYYEQQQHIIITNFNHFEIYLSISSSLSLIYS